MTADWIALPRARQKILRLSGGFALLFALALLVQTATGKLEDIEGLAWAWFFALVGAPVALAAASAIAHRRGAKFLHPAVAKTLFWGLFGYFLFVAAAYFFMQVWVDSTDWSMEAYLKRSLRLLAPLAVAALSAIWFVFYRKEPLFQPNSVEIARQAAQRSAAAAARGDARSAAFFASVADGRLLDAASALADSLEKNGGPPVALSVLKSQLAELQREQSLQTTDGAKIQIELNRIAVGLMAIAGEASGAP